MTKFKMNELFLITCVAQCLAEDAASPNPELEYHIENAAVLFFIAHDHGMSKSEELGEEAVKQIQQVWDDNEGCWPNENTWKD